MPIKIVLVEDSDTVQIAAKMIMQSEREYELLAVKSLNELSANLGSLKPDLLIIDQSLSDNSGAAVDDQPVIYLIPHNAMVPVSPSSRVSYLKKPFDSQSFLKAIQGALASEQKAPLRSPAPLPPMPSMEVARVLQMPKSTPELALSKEELREMARKIIEEVAWEVVPELAESIIREEIRRLTKE